MGPSLGFVPCLTPGITLDSALHSCSCTGTSDGLGLLGRPKLCLGPNSLMLPLSLVSFPGTFPPLQPGLGVLLMSVARSLPSLREQLL